LLLAVPQEKPTQSTVLGGPVWLSDARTGGVRGPCHKTCPLAGTSSSLLLVPTSSSSNLPHSPSLSSDDIRSSPSLPRHFFVWNHPFSLKFLPTPNSTYYHIMVKKRTKNSRREDLQIAPSNPAQSLAPSVPAQSELPVLLLPGAQDIGEQNTTGNAGVDDQPESPDARDEVFLSLLCQAPG
jgi:hypothetical protein